MAEAPKKAAPVEASTQQYLPIDAIKEGVVLVSDHSLKAVIMVSSMNFALKSDGEKDSIIMSFHGFLNSLEFPIQIMTSSKQLDLSNYLAGVKKASEKQQNPFLKVQTEEYVNFINQLLEYSSIMEKRFFVVVPYYPSGVETVPGASGLFKKKQQKDYVGGSFEDHKRKLMERVQVIIEGISSIGLRSAALGTEDLLELYYTVYNPDTAKNQKVSKISEMDVTLTKGAGSAKENPGGVSDAAI